MLTLLVDLDRGQNIKKKMITESEAVSWRYKTISVTDNKLPSKKDDMFAAWYVALDFRNGGLIWTEKNHCAEKLKLENLVGPTSI